MTARRGQTAKTARAPRADRRSGSFGSRAGRALKSALVAFLVAALFGVALYGLLALDVGEPSPAEPAANGAPPVDHIDESSRDALRDLLREEDER